MSMWVYVRVGTNTCSARITHSDMDIDVRWIDLYRIALDMGMDIHLICIG